MICVCESVICMCVYVLIFVLMWCVFGVCVVCGAFVRCGCVYL